MESISELETNFHLSSLQSIDQKGLERSKLKL